MKTSHILLIILLVAIVAIIIGTVTDARTFENFENAARNQGKTVQVVGYLNKEKPLEYDPVKDANRFAFYMFDKDSVEKKVIYLGTKPQDFERSEQIVVTGHMQGDSFIAEKILMKCPSKYNNGQTVEVTGAIETNQNGN